MTRKTPGSWLCIRVELISGGGGGEFDPPPGRDLLVGPLDSFADLAIGIDTAFARWDISHLHSFQLGDGRQIGVPDDDFPELEFEDEEEIRVSSALKKGDEFTYVFDFGDDWTHRCTVLDDDVDVEAANREPPDGIVPIWGWGSIPDQYGRVTPDR